MHEATYRISISRWVTKDCSRWLKNVTIIVKSSDCTNSRVV